MSWWHWLVIGLILIALEMAASGGFYVIFFGIAALAIAGLHVLDWAGPIWVQLVLFSSVSILSLLFFRGPLLRWMKLDQPGQIAKLGWDLPCKLITVQMQVFEFRQAAKLRRDRPPSRASGSAGPQRAAAPRNHP